MLAAPARMFQPLSNLLKASLQMVRQVVLALAEQNAALPSAQDSSSMSVLWEQRLGADLLSASPPRLNALQLVLPVAW